MDDVERLLAASNLEIALADYFQVPSVDEAKALRVIVARLQDDQRTLCARLERAIKE